MLLFHPFSACCLWAVCMDNTNTYDHYSIPIVDIVGCVLSSGSCSYAVNGPVTGTTWQNLWCVKVRTCGHFQISYCVIIVCPVEPG